MHDTHCHIDLYKDPYDVANSTERAKISTIAVTNLPSAYFSALPHMRGFSQLRLAVGLHPLLSEHHTEEEKQLFKQALHETQYVGEIGLDFSKEGIASKEVQISSFRFVLALLQAQPKIVTLHSHRAESEVLELLTEFQVKPVIFHWFSGSVKVLEKVIEAGHYCSVNPAMIRSAYGQKVIGCIAKERLLIESDGPFVSISKRPAVPSDGKLVHQYLSAHWDLSMTEVETQLTTNLTMYLHKIR